MTSQPPVHTIDRTPEYDDFIATLTEFHKQRGTPFEPLPKLGNNHVDLLKLFKYIVKHGGYDTVSDEKLAWRRMCEDLGLMTGNPPAAAFSLKTLFYKYLAAYEIKMIHNKEPPPPEILEHTTARGSGLLTRTLENFAPSRREGAGHKDSDGDEGTPVRERASEDTPFSARATRGLRQDPPQRVMFQPDTGPSRMRHTPSGQQSTPGSHLASGHHSPSQAGGSHHQSSQHHNPHLTAYQRTGDGPSHQYIPKEAEAQNTAVMAYKPQPPLTLPFRAVETPANNPESFAHARRVARSQALGASLANPLRHLTGMENGPNIYMRCREALLSGIPAEQAYALNHLVKISYERGDRYRFEQFPKLLEGLVEKALEVGGLFFDVNWTIAYFDPEDGPSSPGELNGFYGTPDILDRIEQLKRRFVIDGVVSAEFSDQLNLITEALLTIRNMVTHPDNATYASGYPIVEDLLCILLCLPSLEMTVEIKHLALDIAEAVTPHLTLGPGNPLYQALLAQLVKHTEDRGVVLTALCALGRISMDLAETNKLEGVPVEVLQKVKNWLLLNDDDLMGACLDFMYQYTAVVANLETLIHAIDLEKLVAHLVRLLSHGAKREQREIVKQPELRAYNGATVIQDIPLDLEERLLAIEEPERCYKWVRCFFEEDPKGQVTQIDIWQAYNKAFAEKLRTTGRPMMQAAEFIRSINHVYSSAAAKIKREHGPNGQVVDKYAIDGIRPRRFAISPEGIEYFPCLWDQNAQPNTPPQKCMRFIANPEAMWNHILADHLGAARDPETKRLKQQVGGEYTCTWARCDKYKTPTNMDFFVFAAHVKLHMRQAYDEYHGQPKKQSRPVIPAKTITVTTEETAVVKDPGNPNAPLSAGGIPFSATLVLRNIARNIVKTEAQENLIKGEGEANGWNERLFRALRPRLFDVMAENKLLAPHVASLLQAIDET